jgi:hypothetical protein
MKNLAIIFATALVAGCGGEWKKQGATDLDFKAAHYQCRMQAQTAFPPSAPPQGPALTTCRTGPGQVQCLTTQAPAQPAVDQNAFARAGAINACMEASGWEWRAK